METNNNFNAGMDSDISKVFQKPNTYLQALNFRPLTELGGSNGSLVNIKGNECKLTFPTIQNVYKLELIKGTTNVNNSLTININGVSKVISINNNTTGFDIYNFIISNFQNSYSYTGSLVVTKTFDIAYEDNYIVIYQQPIYKDCSTVASIASTISLSFTISNGTRALLYFINSNNTPNSLVQDLLNPYILGMLGSSIIPIGSTFILDETYILTAPDLGDVIVPNDELNSPGSIWKLDIDNITKQHTLTLIYHSNLDFTKFHPIPPSAIQGRYESGNIKRIYWSDNYNKIRTLNTVMPQLMALNPSQLSVVPKSKFTQPILNNIGTGVLDAGCYQMAYRLSKILGSVTNYSELSNPVYLTTNNETDSFQTYQASLGVTTKSIIWKLTDLDITYDQIEPIVIYRNSDSAIPTIKSLGLSTLTQNMTFEYANPATSGYTNTTLEEFLLFNGTFTHAKTVDTKDNRLFWGNVRAPKKDLESFDTRAFRANDAGNIKLTNSGVNNSYQMSNPVGANYAPALLQTEDTINEYYNSTGDYSPNACYLKPSTATTTKILGGEGVNISYEFGTKSINLDNNMSISSSANWNVGTPASPYRNTNLTGTTNEVLVYTYPQNNRFEALKQPERTGLFRGFQHEEIYRFAFQAFDKQGNPYFSKWIGDIKMPSYGDFNNNPDSSAIGAGITDFRLTYGTSYRLVYGQILYIKFKIDISSISDLIGGYEIVRVKRDGNNKTIWGVGLVNPFTPRNGTDADSVGIIPASWNSRIGNFTTPGPVVNPHRYYSPYPSQESVETLNIDSDSLASAANFSKFKMFDSWDFDMGVTPTINSGDKLLIRSRLSGVNYRNSSGDDSYRVFFFNPKNYDSSGNEVPPPNQPIDDGTGPTFITKTNYDSPTAEPFFIMKMLDNRLYSTYQSFLGTFIHDYGITEGALTSGNSSFTTTAGYSLNNYGEDVYLGIPSQTGNPCFGKQTCILVLNTGLYSSTGPVVGNEYECLASNTNPFYKLLALYYKPNNSLYGGNTYVARSNNTYIPCGEYIPVESHSNTVFYKTYGGDVFTTVYDMMKTVKGAGSEYTVYEYNSTGVYQGLATRSAKYSTSFFFPSTCVKNSELRLGNHPNRSISSDGGYGEDQYSVGSYSNAENDIKTYFPKPLNYQVSDEWRARVYFSEIKFDNETTDSWSQYLTNSFHDCEGTYGGINALITLNDQMYYLQDRAIGVLMINPVATSDTAAGPILIGTGETIQKHNNISIDVGTVHQWSVYRSQSAITFVDARHKKIYMFNGSSKPVPISDLKGQRNFAIKRLHNELLSNDNPVIDKGILSTYDYYHNEFLYTFNNVKKLTSDPPVYDLTNDENLTLAYSEPLNSFTGLYSFTPNLYINTNKYLISTNRDNKLWFHNYGTYGNFYGVSHSSFLKTLINEGPKLTKIFNNIIILTEAISDNVEWNDDLNIYPGSPTNPLYPDDVNKKNKTFEAIRCYNQYQNSDWYDLTTDTTIRKLEQGFNIQLPRNKFNYDINLASTYSIFDPSRLTKTSFGERLRDKWLIIDLRYSNSSGDRFAVHNLTTLFRVSDR